MHDTAAVPHCRVIGRHQQRAWTGSTADVQQRQCISASSFDIQQIWSAHVRKRLSRTRQTYASTINTDYAMTRQQCSRSISELQHNVKQCCTQIAALSQVHSTDGNTFPRHLTLSPPIPLRLYTLPPCWSNPPFLIFDIRALWRSGLSARVPECQN